LCNYSCFDCYDHHSFKYSQGTSRAEESSADVRHKFVCFPCRRVWKSYTSKYICQQIKKNHKKEDLIKLVPNIFKQDAAREEIEEAERKYNISRGSSAWGAKIYDKRNPAYDWTNRWPKCAKCGKDALSVGRNFRHCRTEKEWIEMERKVNGGEIDLENDFREYPREGINVIPNINFGEKIKQKKEKIQKEIDEEHKREIEKQDQIYNL
jgi:hypothetical protein